MSRLTPRPRAPLFASAGLALGTAALVPGCPAPMPVPMVPDTSTIDAPPPMPVDAPAPMPVDAGADVASPMPDAGFDAPPPPPMPPPIDAGTDTPPIPPMPPPMPPPK